MWDGWAALGLSLRVQMQTRERAMSWTSGLATECGRGCPVRRALQHQQGAQRAPSVGAHMSPCVGYVRTLGHLGTCEQRCEVRRLDRSAPTEPLAAVDASRECLQLGIPPVVEGNQRRFQDLSAQHDVRYGELLPVCRFVADPLHG